MILLGYNSNCMNEGFFIFGIPCFIFLGIFIYVQNTHKRISPVVFKGLASICFLMYAIYQIIWINNNTHNAIDIGYTIDIFIALGFGMVGDILLNLKNLFKNPIKRYIFFGGVFSFLTGHIFFLVHLFKLMTSDKFSYIDASKVYIPILCAVVLMSVLVFIAWKVVKKDKITKIVGSSYLCVISLLICVSCFNMIMALNYLPISSDNLRNYFIVMFIACFAFASSDVILIFNSFGPHPRPWVSAINLVLYYSAQLLMGLSIFFFYI